MQNILSKIDRNYKLRIIKSVLQGHISPAELKQKFNNNQEREIPATKITITLRERDGKYWDLKGEEVSITNGDIKSYYDKIYPDQLWQVVLLHYRNYTQTVTTPPSYNAGSTTITHYHISQQFEFNSLYETVLTTKARYIDCWGGRARGGSHFGTDYFLFLITQPGYFRGCFLRAVFGDIRGSLWQDFKDRIDTAVEKGDLQLRDFDFDEGKMTVVYKPTGNLIISKGFKKSSNSQSAKLKSLAGMTHVLIEECEEVGEADFNKLDDSIRTNKVERIQVIRLFNPPSKNHWLIKRSYNLVDPGLKDRKGEPLTGWYKAVPKNIPELLAIHSTYMDNVGNLNQSTIDKYKNYGDVNSPKYDEDFYYRDVLGLVSDGKKGRIFTNCLPITYAYFRSLPYQSFYGLDFGYSQDPVALVELKHHNGKLFRHQLIYQPGLTDDDLAKRMRQVGVDPKKRIYADSSEPKSITTLRRKGYIVIPSVKGPDSVLNGIKYLQGLTIYTTEGSDDLILEQEEYSWALDSNKEPTNEPVDDQNHGWDATRYGATAHIQKKGGKIKIANDTPTTTRSALAPATNDDWDSWEE